MRFLLDQGLPRSTVAELAKRGVVAEHVGDLGMSWAKDQDILAESRTRGAIAVTLDADFHTILATTRASEPSVIRIRIEGLKGAAVATILEAVIADASTELIAGAAVTVTRSRHSHPIAAVDLTLAAGWHPPKGVDAPRSPALRPAR